MTEKPGTQIIGAIPKCPKCVLFANVELTCCAPGACATGEVRFDAKTVTKVTEH